MSVTTNKDGSVVVETETLFNLIAAIFDQGGCIREESEHIATHLIDANLTGHDSHGVIRARRYVEWIGDRVFPGRHIETLSETDVTALIDGCFGFGQTVGLEAVRLGMKKAQKSGLSMIALQNAGHLGRIGAWAEMAAEENLVSIHFVNVRASLLMAPFGGIDRRISTAPLAIGIPQADGDDPIILDFSTAIAAEGKALVAHKGGKALPAEALIGADGKRTNDPTMLYGEPVPGKAPNPMNGPGALRTMGDHKGSGLAFMCEIMGGALTGAGCAGPLPRPYANGMTSIYVKPDVFQSMDAFFGEVKSYAEFFRSSRPEDGVEKVLIPGDKERMTREGRLANGIPFPADTWASILDAGTYVGLDDAVAQKIIAD